MPYAYDQIDATTATGRRTIERILALKTVLARTVPVRTIGATLLLATWNIREFESGKYGPRSDESLRYMAEIIDAFDLVAVQEVRDDLSSLDRLLKFLGGHWKFLLTDVTEGTSGNRERLAFLWDDRKVGFRGLAGEIVLPPVKKKGKPPEPARQLARTPYEIGLRAGWFKFLLCTTHILYGTSDAEDPGRQGEIRALASFLAKRLKGKYAWAPNEILLGDLNIFATEDATFGELTKAGFVVPEAIQALATNAGGTKHFDQMAFIAPDIANLETSRAGVFPVFDHVYTDGDEAEYREEMGEAYLREKNGEKRSESERTTYYKQWRTFQMSDHFPLWIELRIDASPEYLRGRLGQPSANAPHVPDEAGPTTVRRLSHLV